MRRAIGLVVGLAALAACAGGDGDGHDPVDALRTVTMPEVCDGTEAAAPSTVVLADLTWPEVCAALAAGYRTILVPSAGIEQNGRHLVLGKHGYIVANASVAIAEELGDALVAPTIEYQPEGTIRPPEDHMRFPGTISVPEGVYEDILRSTAESFRQHGFEHIALLNDSGSSGHGQRVVADDLGRHWGTSAVINVHDYYGAFDDTDWLLAEGETEATIGTHAGIRETAELLAIRPEAIRRDELSSHPSEEADGSDGDPTRATAAMGRELLDRRIAAAVRQIRAAIG